MNTLAQIANAAKVRLQKELVARLRAGGWEFRRQTWDQMKRDAKLWEEIENYDLGAPERQSWLNKVSFPDCNHADVDATLEAGNNLLRLYDVARGKARVVKDHAGNYVRGKKGLKIVDC